AFGGALATAALLHLAAHADALDTRRARWIAAAALALGVLGYSSLVVLTGLFGLVLLALLAVDAEGVPAASRRGLALALVLGGSRGPWSTSTTCPASGAALRGWRRSRTCSRARRSSSSTTSRARACACGCSASGSRSGSGWWPRPSRCAAPGPPPVPCSSPGSL